MQTRKMEWTVVGSVADDDQRRETVGALRAAGFSDNQIGSANETAELVIQDGALARADVAGRGLFAVLVDMGAPEKAAQRFAREFAEHKCVVTLQTRERVDEATSIFKKQAARVVERW